MHIGRRRKLRRKHVSRSLLESKALMKRAGGSINASSRRPGLHFETWLSPKWAGIEIMANATERNYWRFFSLVLRLTDCQPRTASPYRWHVTGNLGGPGDEL